VSKNLNNLDCALLNKKRDLLIAFFIFGPKPPTSVGGYHHLGFA
jgi:hypothetical protein